MNQSAIIKKILWLCVWQTAYMAAGEPFRFVREPKVRVTPVYYELIGIKVDGKSFKDWFEELVEGVSIQEEVKKVQGSIDILKRDSKGFQDDLQAVNDRLKENKTLPQQIKDLELQALGAGLTARSAEIDIQLAQMREKLNENDQLLSNKQALEQKIKQLRAEEQKTKQAMSNVKMELIVTGLASIPTEQIKAQCQETRERLIQDSRSRERDLSEARLSGAELMRTKEKLDDIKFDLQQSAHACPLLMNEKRRLAYNKNLAEARLAAEAHLAPEGLIDALKNGVARAHDDPPDVFTIVNDIAGKFLAEDFKNYLKELFGDIPEATTKIFNQNLALRSIDFLPKPLGQDVRFWVGFSGLMGLNQFDVRVSVYIIQDLYGITRTSIAVELPDYYKPSDLIPTLKFLDMFSFPKAKLIFSNFEYYDHVRIRRGLTFVAEVNYSGPLKILNDLKDKSSYFKSLIFAGEPAVLSGYLPADIGTNYLDTEFEIRVPFRFGFDLRQMSLVPTMVSNVINQVTSDDFVFTVRPQETKVLAELRKKRTEELVEQEAERIKGMGVIGAIAQQAKGLFATKEQAEPFLKKVTSFAESLKGGLGIWGSFNIQAEAGARIVLGTQPEPISLTLLGSISPNFNLSSSSLLAAANLKKMLELKWFALGNATIQFEWDGALMAVASAAGIPFTGLGMKGHVDLGKPGESRAHVKVAGGFRVTTTETPDVLFNVEGENIRFADFLSYASYLASRARILRAPIPVEKIPTMTFSKVEGYVSLGDMRIGRTVYPAGLRLWLESELFNKKFGLQLALSDRFELSGFGYMPRIDARFRGTEIFKLYNSLQPDRGPLVSFMFDMQKPLEGHFKTVGALEIPALRLKQDVQFLWSGWMLDADFESSLAGISIGYGVRINTKPSKPVDLPKTDEEPVLGGKKEEKRAVEKEKGEQKIQKLPERLSEIKKMEPAWKSLTVKFSFKDEFADYMTKTATPLLRKMKDAALQKIKTAMTKLVDLKAKGVRGFEAELARAQRSVSKTKAKLAQAKSTCAKARWYKKFVCAQVAAQQSILITKKSYLNALLKPTKAIATKAAAAATKAAQMSAAAWRKTMIIQEFALESALIGLELIKNGLSIFKLREFAGEYSFEKNKVPIIKRLIVELNISDKPTLISLYEVPLNFANLFGAIETITRQLLNEGLGKGMEYVEIVEGLRH